MRQIVVTVATALLILGTASAGGSPSQKRSTSAPKPPIGALANINGEVLTVDELREGFVKRHGGHEKFLGGVEELRKFIEIIVDQRLLIQEAYNLGLQDQDDIRKATEQYAKEKAFEYLIKSQTEDKSHPTEEEIRAAWQANTTQVYLVQEIVVDTRQEAEETRAMLLRGAEFETIARSCSIVPSKMHGGRLGTVGWGAMDPEWERVVFSLDAGEISPVFETANGWCVVQLVDKMPFNQPAYSSVRSRLEGVLIRRKLAESRTAFSAELWSRYHVEVTTVDHSAESLLELRTSAPETVIATWDGGTLALKDFLSEGELRMLRALPPGRAKRFFDDQLRLAVNEPLVRLDAKVRKIKDVPEVAGQIRRFQEDLMERALYADHILKDVNVTDADVKAYYEQHTADLQKPERRHVAHIVVAMEDAARVVREKAARGEPWDELVKANSLDTQTVKSAGDLGWITKKDTPPEFASVLSLREDEISQPLQSKYGWHIVKVLEVEPGRPLMLDEAKVDVRQFLIEQAKREKRAYWVKKLREHAKIKVNDAAVRRYVDDNPFEEAKATPKSH